MKRFYYTDSPDNNSKKGDRICRIYKMKSGVMVCISECTYRPGCGTKGPLAEVFSELMRIGEIPRKYETSSVSSWSGPGYFLGEVTKNYSIQEIY